MEDLQSKYKGKIDFVKVDTTLDGMGTISEAMGVKVFPTFKLFNNGNEVGLCIRSITRVCHLPCVVCHVLCCSL